MAAERRANLIGAGFMVAAMAAFAIEDALIKLATANAPIGVVLMGFGLGGAAIFALWARLIAAPIWTKDAHAPAMRLRYVFEISGRLFYVLALWLTPLSSATLILQATPLVVVGGAALFMGERVGWRRWLAIALGLCGVLLILRPGTASFTPLSIFAVLGMLGFAGRDLASRAAPKTISLQALGFFGFVAIFVAGLFLWLLQLLFSTQPAPPVELIPLAIALSGATLAGVAAYACLMTAMRTGDVSAVTPFRYTRLIFGTVLGLVIFGERLDPAMVVGSGLIVLSGLFLVARGRMATTRHP